MDNLIEIKKLCKRYKKAEDWAVKNLSMVVKRGEVCALLGHNGAGKTTTLKCIVNHLIPQEGEIRIMGRENKGEEIKKFIGYLPEDPFLPLYYSVREVLDIGASIWQEESKRVEELLSFFELKKFKTMQVLNLSKGNLQKLAIAFTTIHKPDIYIWDEPTEGLDPIMRIKVVNFIKNEIKNGKSFLISSHILTEVEILCDRFYIIKNGELIKEGKKEELLEKNKSLESIYIECYENNKDNIP
jgi:ABC-2 type transport system ATP-binding protein